ncbi:5-formyltetrahydrofolate cyclo-ligase [Methylopila sp. M107]|uniref:5-formyltetrahydrofolate cyclo-ligase n=1 Tax=Methylopila sp. M107 TaxID=1101190 RepID=UPI0003A17FAF|nr:5-formyltetrahydrofolate cyclo-ligase [Methylopila sp. M107]
MSIVPQVSDLATAKAELRKAALAARAALGEAERIAAAHAIAQLGGEIVAGERPARVSLFFSVKGEIDTGPLAQKLHAAGVPLCLPVIVRKGAPLVFRSWKPGDRLDEKPFGLREPPESAGQVTPDLLFVPLAAFDAAGARVGYGGGFYDRTLDKLRGEGPAYAVGLAFAAQEVEAVPVARHDEPLDAILTEAGVILPGR